MLLSVFTTRCSGGGRGLDRFLPSDRTTWYAAGRFALRDALSRIGVGPGASVLVPGFICREVEAAVIAAGAEPDFYAVGPSLTTDEESLERAAGDRVRAVVAVNYFGVPQPLAAFQRWSATRRVAMIEDNAHGLLSLDGDLPLGHRADLGIFSLRKTLAVPDGGALVDNRADGFGAPGRPPRRQALVGRSRYRAKTMAKQVMAWGGIATARVVFSAVRAVRPVANDAVPPDAGERSPSPPADAISRETLERIQDCDVIGESARRRRLYAWCSEALGRSRDVEPVFDALPQGAVPHAFPFRYRGDRPDTFIASWWRRGVMIRTWPDLPTAMAATAPAHYRDVLMVPFLW